MIPRSGVGVSEWLEDGWTTGCHVLSWPFGRGKWMDWAETGYHVLSSSVGRENKKTRKRQRNSAVQQTVGDMSHLIIGSTKAFQMAFIAT
jgi:hypothetical protein